MANLTAAQQAMLEKSMEAIRRTDLGTWLADLYTLVEGQAAATGLKKGMATVTAPQATANLVNISTGLAAVTSWIVQVYRAGVDVTADAVVSAQTGGVLRVADGSATLDLAEGDKIMWLAW